MDEQELPVFEEVADAIENVLNNLYPMHGGWVMGVEVYDKSGTPFIASFMSDTARWHLAGIARVLTIDVERPFNEHADGCTCDD